MAEDDTEPSDLNVDECQHTGQRGRLPISTTGDSDRNYGLVGESSMQGQLVASLDDSDSEYEEVEVADDWDGDERGVYQNPLKRQRIEEFDEDDIAFQLQAAAEGLDESGMGSLWGTAGNITELEHEDAPTVFKSLLDDFGINPYSSWEKIIEEGKLFDDPRYTILETMKARKTVWEDWSRTKIRGLKEQKAKEEKADPLLSYLSFLQRCATPRLFWPEFRRKYRKEAEIRDLSLSDKEKEKWYRDYVNRLKLPPATLKLDFTKLLKTIPVEGVEENILPRQIATDIRYICLDAKVREPLIKAYFQSIRGNAS
ncbi:ff domain containing protein [Grosmannia clavigera kw1407]|uniref:Ff domain containing protein n=1 Tax=Grosmannia clavigera (strain kw1407 / UAMH 11150) TaxID=655863 RepID=F0X6H9_GROCL|nr:ff domain containing protein [Grosmannia clavigera kw1407]EFX06711.1 ff domain containing protein [Grosmannia clavigera kw1407]